MGKISFRSFRVEPAFEYSVIKRHISAVIRDSGAFAVGSALVEVSQMILVCAG